MQSLDVFDPEFAEKVAALPKRAAVPKQITTRPSQQRTEEFMALVERGQLLKAARALDSHSWAMQQELVRMASFLGDADADAVIDGWQPREE
jgi:hypothetical protein